KNTDKNFDVTFEIGEDGKLTIMQLAVTVTVTGHSKSVVYNGLEQSVSGYELDIPSSLYAEENIVYKGDSTAKGIDVDTYYMDLQKGDFSNSNNNFNVTFVIESDGSITITPLDVIVEITGNTKKVQYNGYEQKVTGFVFEANTELYHKGDIDYSGDSLSAGTTIGSYYMNLTSGQFSNNNKNFGEVTFHIVTDGSLTIIPLQTPITISANSAKMVYDGSPLSEEGYRFTKNVLVAGDVLSAVVEGEITNVGEVPNVVSFYRVTHLDAKSGEKVDVTENYTFNPSVDGKLTVTKRSVLLRSESDNKVYDGQPLTNTNVKVVGDLSKSGFAYGEGATYDVTGTITEIGSVENEFTYKLRSNTKAENYDISVEFGTLTVTMVKDVIIITANSKTDIYTGQPLKDNGFTYTPDILAKGDELVANIVGEVTHVGSADNVVEDYKVLRGTQDVTKNYSFGACEKGLLTVEPRPVILTSATESKVYDRKPLLNQKVTIGGEGFATGEGATFEVPNSIVNPGSVENGFTYTLNVNTLADNYTIKTIVGTLTIEKRPTAILFDYGYKVKSDTLGGYADEAYKVPADPVRKGYDFEAWKPTLPALLPLDTTKVEAQWRRLTYTVVLDTFSQFTYTVEDNKVIDLADYTPVREGYDFNGWLDAKGNMVKSVNTDDALSMNLKATWSIATFNIDYYSDGKLWKQVPVVYGESIEKMKAPIRIGYIFNGWTPTVPATMPAGGVKVEADWEIITFNLLLMDEGRDAGAITYTVEDPDFYLDKLADRAGMAFSGWMMDGEMLAYDETLGQYIFSPKEVASDVVLEASWTIVSNEFTLLYNVDGVKHKSFYLMAGEKTADYVAMVKDPQPKKGYMFDGWDLEVPSEMPRKDLTINALWKPISYKLVLKDTTGKVVYSTNYTVEDEVLLPTFEDSEGRLDFKGWSDGKSVYTEFDPKQVAADVELVELWKVKTFEVVYYVQNDVYARDTFAVGDTLIKQPDPDQLIEGYAFSGWSETPAYMPSHDIKVTSYYERGGYTLTYKSEGQIVKSVRYLYKAPISPSRGISKFGYEFKYWSGVPATMPAMDIEVEAVYNVATYQIVLRDGNVGIDTLYYTIYDDDIILPTLEEKGRVFRGWYDGIKSFTKIKTGTYATNLDLVPNWVYINYTVTFNVDGVRYSRKSNMHCGDPIPLPKDPTKPGEEFVRWEGMPEDGLMPDDDLVLTAVFSSTVGEEVVEQAEPIVVYSEEMDIHILHAENLDVTVMDLSGVVLYMGKVETDHSIIPMKRHGLYLVRVKDELKKVIVK
ncbi:MAG: InlB B-repeat-containing protein, partial [Paludibacteraceae bacterium]|nr:InlB B-repeat-containing protein [Paludibacteraceae bacterium]